MKAPKEKPGIPIGKVSRAAKVFGAGAKVGGNYIKYFARKALDPDTDRKDLDEANAAELYRSLGDLKGTALKVAQMVSMDQGVLPRAFFRKFQQAQYQAPPLSYPLVVKTFRTEFGKGPEALFDTFSHTAVNAASIGQVHRATLGNRVLAVKVQYPGVAQSVESDLQMLRPIAKQLMKVKGRQLDRYMDEVRQRLREETDYDLELRRSQSIAGRCANIHGLTFARYYPELSGTKVLTMDWIAGRPIAKWLSSDPPQTERNRIGQAMWDFYMFQFHDLREIHADPHPGNFIVTEEGELAVIDFGCVKDIPEEFYRPYFSLMQPGLAQDRDKLSRILGELDLFNPSDTPGERTYIIDLVARAVDMLSVPFNAEVFDFGDRDFFAALYAFGEGVSRDPKLRNNNPARGSQHGIYVNRTFFGLFNILHEMRALVRPSLKERIAGLSQI